MAMSKAHKAAPAVGYLLTKFSPTDQVANRDAAHGWYALEGEHVLAVMDSNVRDGLSSEEARLRLKQHGPNELAEGSRRGPVRMLLAQFTDVMVLVLLAAAVIAGFLGEPQDIAAILAIVLLNAILGFVQEYRAERAVAALKALSAFIARVRRDGEVTKVPASELVPGDVVLLEAGNVVPADLRLLEVASLRVDEAALTGESQPVDKISDVLRGRNLALGDHRNMAYKGTVATYGRAVGVVVATGMRTELGRIAALLRQVEETRTPLQARLARLGRNLAVAVVVLCVVIFGAGLLRGGEPGLMFMTALSLAVAAIPEALPAVVTMSLALGARKMVRHHALIRRLPAVETLGSVTYICSDKTGTLTENRMRVEVLRAAGNQGFDPAAVSRNGPEGLLVRAIALNNDAKWVNGELTGDPTETALVAAATVVGVARDAVMEQWPRIAEIPFSSERARMTTIHRHGDESIAFTKGAPERVVAGCTTRLGRAGPETLDVPAALGEAEAMAAAGLRVLAVAMRPLTGTAPLDDAEHDQTLLGFVGLLDPPRAEVKEAVALCQSAGIRVVMITGDHRATARAIAERLNIAAASDATLTGSELAALSAEELDAIIGDVRVYARVAPEDKIRIVKALQRRGQCVAMTGDGVNDAPALRRADIGVAMGKTGTDVAREAAHMVLVDDNFATIVRAVREGRRVYDNIRRFVRYTLSTNSGELWTLFLAPFVGLPVPLLPIQILWMNLVTDGLPGLALAAEPAERDIMHRPPRPPTESILAHGLWQHMLWVGLLMAALTLGTQSWALYFENSHWQSMVFTVLTLAQLAHVLAIRSERESLFTQGVTSNKPLLGAVVLTVVLQLATLYVPALARVLKTTRLTFAELLSCVGLASVVFFAVEAEKRLRRRADRRVPGIP
jgi:Ca2+-transporting ATPase